MSYQYTQTQFGRGATAVRAKYGFLSVWLTLNRVQENLIRGGIFYRAEREINGRARTVRAHTRPVQSIDGNVSLNRQLWAMAAELSEAT
jgi:hypothetical protein